MKSSLFFFFLFYFSTAFAQQHIFPSDVLKGTYHNTDSAQEQQFKDISEKYRELERNEKTMAETLDSLERIIKNQKDELTKTRLDILLLLIKNDKAGDVYAKMQEFGDKAILNFNKEIAAPAFFYRLDKEHVQLVNERKNIELTARSISNDYNTDIRIKQAKKEEYTKSTPYDSLKTIIKLRISEEAPKSFLDELCKLYKKPVNTETTASVDFDVYRIITCGETTEVFEKKTWIWGGTFCFYNGKTSMSLEEFQTKSQESILKALNYHEQHKAGEK